MEADLLKKLPNSLASVWLNITQCWHLNWFDFARNLSILSKIPSSSVRDILSWVDSNYSHNLVVRLWSMFLVYFSRCPREHTNSNQPIDNTELVDSVRQQYILERIVLGRRSIMDKSIFWWWINLSKLRRKQILFYLLIVQSNSTIG